MNEYSTMLMDNHQRESRKEVCVSGKLDFHASHQWADLPPVTRRLCWDLHGLGELESWPLCLMHHLVVLSLAVCAA
jgi:hypothetical protein